MSEAAEAPKKKGGKMPVMIAMVAVLAGGGYFMMGRSAPKETKEPEPELGAIMPLGEKELIVNLQEREFFLRASIAVQMDKYAKVGHGGGDGHGKKGGPSPEELLLRQVAMERLATVSIRDISTPGFGTKIRRLLAADFNHALHSMHAEEEDKKDSKKKKDKDEEEEHGHSEHEFPKPGDLSTVNLSDVETPGWDSDEGPVLKVYFVEFATMRE